MIASVDWSWSLFLVVFLGCLAALIVARLLG